MPNKHKTRIVKNGKDYQEWLGQHDSVVDGEFKDILTGENRWDGHSPWAQRPLSEYEQECIEALYRIYDTLEGRQKQIVKLLFRGFTRQSDIAKALSMKQSNVSAELKKIRKKMLADII